LVDYQAAFPFPPKSNIAGQVGSVYGLASRLTLDVAIYQGTYANLRN